MPYPNDMTANHLGAQGQPLSYEPQRNNNALLVIYGVSSNNPDDVLRLALKGFSGPSVDHDVKIAGYLNEKRKFAGTPSFQDLEVTYRDSVDVNVASLLLNWNQQVYNHTTGRIGLKKNYAKNGEIWMFGPDGSPNTSDGKGRIYTLQGLWPISFSHDRFDMDSDELVNISMRLAVDKWIPSSGFASSAV